MLLISSTLIMQAISTLQLQFSQPSDQDTPQEEGDLLTVAFRKYTHAHASMVGDAMEIR